MRLLKTAPIVSAKPAVFLLSTGSETIYACSGEKCVEEPQAEVVVTYHRGGAAATLWCVGHLPNLRVLARSPEVAGVELKSTVRGS